MSGKRSDAPSLEIVFDHQKHLEGIHRPSPYIGPNYKTNYKNIKTNGKPETKKRKHLKLQKKRKLQKNIKNDAGEARDPFKKMRLEKSCIILRELCIYDLCGAR